MGYGAGSVTYAAAEPVGQPVGTMTYAAPAMTYAAPQTYSAPIAGQPTYTISPERFQLILQGQPLTAEEIAAMTGGAAPVGTSAAVPVGTLGAQQSFVMPDMFSSPGITNIDGGAPPAASTVIETPAAVASTVVETAAVVADKKEKKSSKKSSKKKVSSKKKAKG